MTRNKFLISYQSALDLHGAYQMLLHNLLPRKRFFLGNLQNYRSSINSVERREKPLLIGDASHIAPKDSAGLGLPIARDVFQNFNSEKREPRRGSVLGRCNYHWVTLHLPARC
ncbi:hypothetical protein CDAR_175191 [Caerostris darwini]|uniref:FAD-binding domain-containing protein n=1 Tax=Caerostris darwini TaxID=1538125 RepID=A0AAV4VYK9_9ARAC|nr:hypothetical protein CDAR_175191 [Caerostris darwini]